MSRVITKENRKLKLEDSTDDDSDAESEVGARVARSQEQFKPVRGMHGMFYKVMVQDGRNEGRKEMFYLTTHSTHFIYCYMASDIW